MIKTALIYFILDYCIEKFSKQLQINLSTPFDLTEFMSVNVDTIRAGQYYDVVILPFYNFKDSFPTSITAPDDMQTVLYDCYIVSVIDDMITVKYDFRLESAYFSSDDRIVDAIEEINSGKWGSRVSLANYAEDMNVISLDVDWGNVDATVTIHKSELLGAYNT